MAVPASILVYGRDVRLLETRCLLLQKAGFEVFTTSDLAELRHLTINQQVNLFILCHTLSSKECEDALTATHALQPEVKNLILAAAAPVCSPRKEDSVFSIFEGPRALIATVGKMINGTHLSASSL